LVNEDDQRILSTDTSGLGTSVLSRAHFEGVWGPSNGHLKLYLHFLFYIAKVTISCLFIESVAMKTHCSISCRNRIYKCVFMARRL